MAEETGVRGRRFFLPGKLESKGSLHFVLDAKQGNS